MYWGAKGPRGGLCTGELRGLCTGGLCIGELIVP